MDKKPKIKLLWLAPNFNHYKARFLNHLAKDSEIDLTILSGSGRQDVGHKELQADWVFNHFKVLVTKHEFGKSKRVRNFLNQHFNRYDWILIPAEKKNVLLFVYALWLRLITKNTRLVSYNHPILKSGNGQVSFLDKIVTKFFNRFFDRIIFYTETSYDWAIQQKLITPKKAFWANNTIDNTEIEKYYSFHLPPKNEPRIVFIGRLIASKKIDVLLDYFQQLKRDIPNLELDIIGDGPESSIVKKAVSENSAIKWHGTLIDEEKIAPIMKKASIVFIPGHSGLSINHAFAYGRPYMTLEVSSHAPEIDYIKHGVNGYVFDQSFENNIKKMVSIISDENKLQALCNEAQKTGVELSVLNWVQQMKSSFKND